jgi:hypothetical protein
VASYLYIPYRGWEEGRKTKKAVEFLLNKLNFFNIFSALGAVLFLELGTLLYCLITGPGAKIKLPLALCYFVSLLTRRFGPCRLIFSSVLCWATSMQNSHISSHQHKTGEKVSLSLPDRMQFLASRHSHNEDSNHSNTNESENRRLADKPICLKQVSKYVHK